MDYKCSVKVYKVIENSPGKFATVLFESESTSHKNLYDIHFILSSFSPILPLSLFFPFNSWKIWSN